MLIHSKLIFVLIALIFIFLPNVLLGATAEEIFFNPQATFKETAERNKIKAGQLREELQLSSDIRGKSIVAELGLTKKQVSTAVSHLRGDFILRDITMAQLLFAFIIAFVIVLLSRKKMSHQLKFLLLIGVILGVGFGLGKSLNPMTGLVKVFKGLMGLEGNLGVRLIALFVFSLMAIVGTKAVCGWACPYGALQEFLHKLPLLGQWKKRNKIPFWITNTVRIGLFLFFLYDLSFDLFHLKGMGRVMYHYVNPFNLFEWHFTLLSVSFYVSATLILSLFFYRPHCHLVCPFGLYSWFMERISIFRICINREKCTDCKACVKACPGFAMKGIYEESRFPPDCFSCGECLMACRVNAISYTRKRKINPGGYLNEQTQ